VGSYLRRIDFVYHSTLGSRVIKKKRRASPHQPSEWDQILFFKTLNLYWTSPGSGATVVHINGLEKDDLGGPESPTTLDSTGVVFYRDTWLIRNTHPARITIGA